MSLIYGPSAIAFSNISPDYYLVGVGPYIRIYKNDIFVTEHCIFPMTTRIVYIAENDKYTIAYASNIVKIIAFNPDFSSYSIVRSEEFEDNVIAASIDEFQSSEENLSLSVVLHHGQLCRVTDTITVSQPKVWKIVTSAYIVNHDMFISGDSFGCVSVFLPNKNTEISNETEYGTVFGIDFDKPTKRILAAYEFRACGLFEYTGKKIIPIWIMKDHPSRVWGCKFLPIGPISFGEDGCIHLFKKIKVEDDDDDILNLPFTLFDSQPDIIPYCLSTPESKELKEGSKTKNKKDSSTPISLAILQNGEVIVGLFGGSIISLPSHREMLVGEEYDGWYLMQSCQNIVFGASRSHHHYLLQVKPTQATEGDENYEYFSKVFDFPNNCSAVSLAINPTTLVAAYSDNNIRVYDFEGTEKVCFSISEYIKKPPIAMCIHQTRHIICFGSHSSRVVVLCFNDNFSEISSSYLIQSASNDGFRGIIFCGDFIYCAGRTDGTVSIIGENNGEWALKSSWRIAAQCKATAGIDSIFNDHLSSEILYKGQKSNERPIVSVVTKDGIGMWDIETQTMISHHPPINIAEKLTIKFTSDRTYTLTWIDHSTVNVQPNIDSIPAFSIGTSFHGLRGLCMTKLTKSGKSLIATGGCDRDVKLWRVFDDGTLKCVESLQAVDSGTHSVSFHSEDSLLFAGGSKEYLYVWKLNEDDQLFRLNIFQVGDNSDIYKLRVTSMSVTSKKRLFIGMSDASVRVFDYSLDENNLKFIQKVELKGVPVSSTYVTFEKSEVVTFATSTGDVYWFIQTENDEFRCSSLRIANCGIHCVRSFVFRGCLFAVTAGDNGSVKLWSCERCGETELEATERISIDKGHTGGTKALAVDVSASTLRLLSFSYDQKAVLYIIDLNEFMVLESREFASAVTDGIACEFVEGGFVVFGFAIQFIKESE